MPKHASDWGYLAKRNDHRADTMAPEHRAGRHEDLTTLMDDDRCQTYSNGEQRHRKEIDHHD